MSTENRRVVIGAAAWGLAALMLMGFAWLAVQSYQTITAVREAQKSNQSTLTVIRDCTEEGGKCFEDGQKRTGEVVADIGKVSAYAAACADQPGVQGADEVLSCVLDRLAADEASSKSSEE